MHVSKLHDGHVERCERFLSQHAETSMFLRGNIKRVGLEYREKEYHGEYFGAWNKAGNMVGVLAHCWNGNVIMQAQDNHALRLLASAFANAVARPIVGILGPDEQAKIVIDALSLSGEAYATNRRETLYALDLKMLSMPATGNFCNRKIIDARSFNKGILTRWLRSYHKDYLGLKDGKMLDAEVASCVHRTMNSGDYWVLLMDGEPVSLSGFNARLPEIVQVGPVWTPLEHRNRGYARTLVAMTLQKVAEESVKKAILFTSDSAAVKAYQAIGFNKIGFYCLALLKNPINLTRRVEA